MTDSQPPGAPRSATSFPLTLIALMVGLVAAGLSQHLWPNDPENTLLWGCGAITATIALVEFLLLDGTRRASTGLAARALRAVDLADAVSRFLGLLLTLATIGLIYWLLPEYHGTFYRPYWHFLYTIAWPTLCLAPLYFLWIGRRLIAPSDPYRQLGRMLIGRDWDEIDYRALRAHCLAWTVKAFFLPLMVVYLIRQIDSAGAAFRTLSWNTTSLYHFFYELSFLIDLLFCVVGYSLSLRIFDTHVRSTEQTVLGWVAALICYQPFYSIVGNVYLRYDSPGIVWDTWLAGLPIVRTLWATAIIGLTLVYALSTVSFGLRFSNLTHRGIITSGPYSFTRHPAYLSKNLSWWLISVPFVSHTGWFDAVRHCGALALLNLIYFVRARTEERHLSRDPVYVAYSDWIREHGLFARLWPWSRHRASRAAASHDGPGSGPVPRLPG